jgi:glyceraldehyde 3-phosphate dehydrogenase
VLAWYDNEWAYACRVVDFANVVLDKREEKAGIVWKQVAETWV